MADDDLQINQRIRIPLHEISYRATRAGGPGGQHVNTSSTRVELWWDAAHSPSLTEAERARLMERLGARLDSEGWLRLVSAGSRSQWQNRQEVTARFIALLADALRVRKPRRKTRPTRAAREERLADKRRRSELKRQRRPRLDD